MPAAGRTPVLATLAVLFVIAATAVLLLFNPVLALWVAAGILVGWLARLIAHELGRLREPSDDQERRSFFGASPRRVTAAALGLVAGLIGATILFFDVFAGLFPAPVVPPFAVVVVPVTYEAQANLDDSAGAAGEEAFVLGEQVLISEAAIAAYAKEHKESARDAADGLARILAGAGWENPQLRAGALWLERLGQAVPVGSIGWPAYTTVALPVPAELRAGDPFVLDGGSVEVNGVKHAVLRTTPSSDPEELASGREQWDVALESEDDEVAVDVAHPSLRNDLGAFLLGLSVGAFAKGALLLVWGLFLDRIREVVKAFFKRVFGRSSEPEPPVKKTDSAKRAE